jgi:hypothetical protein
VSDSNQGRPKASDQVRREVIRQQQIGVTQAQQATQANRTPRLQPKAIRDRGARRV